METWKEIYPDYFVSSLGRVKSDKGKSERILKTRVSGTRTYELVTLMIEKKLKTFSVHRLAGRAFLNLKEDQVINHKDKDTTNNMLYNLEACTSRHNMIHAHTGRKRFVNRVSSNKFVVWIRHNDFQKYYGSFDTKEEAYEIAYQQYFKLFNKYPWSK